MSFQPLRTGGNSAPTSRFTGCYGWGPSRPVPIYHSQCKAHCPPASHQPITLPVKPRAGCLYCHGIRQGQEEALWRATRIPPFPGFMLPLPPSPNTRRSGLLPTQGDHGPLDLLTDPPSPPERHPGLRPLEPCCGPWGDAGWRCHA